MDGAVRARDRRPHDRRHRAGLGYSGYALEDLGTISDRLEGACRKNVSWRSRSIRLGWTTTASICLSESMPIRPELRVLYPPNWSELSRRVRFERAAGECEGCRRPHGMKLRCLPDGRWYDPRVGTWRDRRGRSGRWPDLEEMTRQYTTRVILAAAHVDHDPTRSGQRNLKAWCQRCHLQHDRAWHLLQRWVGYRLRYARGDLFLGPYRRGPAAGVPLAEILAQIAARLARGRAAERPRIAGRTVFVSSLPLL